MAEALRVHALDACTLDRELTSLLSSYWERATSHLGPSLCARLQPELHAALGAALWALSALHGEPTPGQALLGLRATATRAAELAGAGSALLIGRHASGVVGPPPLPRPPLGSRLLLLAVAVLIPYLWARIGRALATGGSTAEDAERRLHWWRRMRRAEAAAALAALATSLRHLLRAGGAPTLALALSGLRHVYASPLQARLADLSYMNQELAWRAFADLAAAIQTLRTAIAAPARLACRIPSAGTSHGGREGGHGHIVAGGVRGAEELVVPPERWRHRVSSWLSSATGFNPHQPPAAHLPTGTCGFCEAHPMHSARSAVCGCTFCYFCLATACLREAAPTCPRCGAAPLAVAARGASGGRTGAGGGG